jgi:nucleoside-diphosphate-sugar epimerase
MNISILGCGWLGLPLAKRLIDAGHLIKGSTTKRDRMESLKSIGITPFQLKLFEEGVQGDLNAFLSNSELLIIDIPPGLRKDPEANFIGKMGRLQSYIKKSSIKRVIFISSTSVYEDIEAIPVYNEEDKPNGTAANAIQLKAAEQLFLNSEDYTSSIIRFGGLFGPGRHPVNNLSGKPSVKDPAAPVNLIHLEDCIGIIETVISKEISGVLNAVYPEHPAKEEYYISVANKLNLPAPVFEKNKSSRGKIIESIYLKEKTGYQFKSGIWE